MEGSMDPTAGSVPKFAGAENPSSAAGASYLVNESSCGASSMMSSSTQATCGAANTALLSAPGPGASEQNNPNSPMARPSQNATSCGASAPGAASLSNSSYSSTSSSAGNNTAQLHYQLQQPPAVECLPGGGGTGCSDPGIQPAIDSTASASSENALGGHAPLASPSPAKPGWTALENTPPVEIKLFVGRVPRTADESVLRPVFDEHGVVTEIAIIIDRTTQMHKGSAFVRMASITQADAAVRALNNIKVLDPQLGALQVRYATGEAEKLGMTPDSAYPGQDQAKLFVGSLPRNVTEEEVRSIFGRFGQLDEIFIMKDGTTGQGKGCAFVKFAYKEQAIHAIKTISGITQLPGAPRPLEVRFAESKKTMVAAPVQAATYANPGAQNTGKIQPGSSGPILGAVNNNTAVAGMGAAQMNAGLPRQAASVGLVNAQPGQANPQLLATSNQFMAPQNPAAANNNPRTAGPWKEYFTDDGRAYYHNGETNVTQWERPPEFDRQDVAGPPGANIFVFHVPNDWTQQDLMSNFHHFGQIVSARIATDKATGRNKGYAFVSFNSIHSAAHAVQHMNGFMAGTKRLKVSIKQNEEIYVQHLLNGPPAPVMNTGGAILGNPGANMAAATPMGSYRGMVPTSYAQPVPSQDPNSMAAQAMTAAPVYTNPQTASGVSRYGCPPTTTSAGMHNTASSHRYYSCVQDPSSSNAMTGPSQFHWDPRGQGGNGFSQAPNGRR